MTTAAEAAREFVTGPHVIQAAEKLLAAFQLTALCEALAIAKADDAESLIAALERLTDFDEVRQKFLEPDVVAFLSEGAAAPNSRVRQLVGRLLVRLCQSNEASVTAMQNAGLLSLCEQLIVDDETSVAESAVKAVRSAVAWPSAQKALLGGSTSDGSSLVEHLQSQLDSFKDVQRIRILNLFVELGRDSENTFALLERRGSYEKVLAAFLTDDLLLKLNVVELMDTLGSFPAGQDLLGKKGVPEQLARDLQDPYCDDSVRMCVTRLLGSVIRRTPSAASALLTSREAAFPQSVARLLDSRDHAEKLCALKAWADASAQTEGLSFFFRWTPLLEDILTAIASTQNEISKGAMHCWANLLQERLAPRSQEVTSGIDVELWQFAEQRVLPLVLKNLKAKPFPDVRAETWRILSVLLRSRKAAQQALPSSELRELLLDFASEAASEARISKHECVKTLVQEHGLWLGNFLDPEVADLLTTYSKQGPHWLPRGAAAMVGDSAA